MAGTHAGCSYNRDAQRLCRGGDLINPTIVDDVSGVPIQKFVRFSTSWPIMPPASVILDPAIKKDGQAQPDMCLKLFL